MARTRKNDRAAALAAIIDASAENATGAPIIDHETQTGSWTPSHDLSGAPIVEQPSDEDLAAYAAMQADEVQELEAVVSQIEAVEDQAAGEVLDEPATTDAAPETFEDLVATFDDERVEDTVFAIKHAVDDREAFEREKNEENANIQRTLKKVRSALVTKRAARVLLATQTAPHFINRSIHQGNRYNVYALGKYADLVYGLTGGAISNAINIACMKSLFRFRAAGLQFTGEMARAAASNKIRVDAAVRAHLVRHTVSESTAPTQASSTMQALATLGVVRVTGSTRNPVYEVVDGPVTRKLEELMQAA